MSRKLLMNKSLNTTIQPIVSFDRFDSVNRKVIDSKQGYELLVTEDSVVFNKNNIYVPSTTISCGVANIPILETLDKFTISYIIEPPPSFLTSGDSNNRTQFLSGSYVDSFYFWISSRYINTWINNIKILDDNDYSVFSSQEIIKYLDMSVDLVAGDLNFFVNGNLKVSKKISIDEKIVNSQLFLNHSGGAGSTGDFKLYKFKIYNKNLSSEEILINIENENI